MGILSQYEQAWEKEWKEICQRVSELGPTGQWISESILQRITVNAPVTMLFALICILVHALTFGGRNQFLIRWLAVHDEWHGLSLTQYTSFWTHTICHSDYGHLKGNLTLLLLVGPSVEFHFGSQNVLLILIVVSLVSAMVHILIGKPHTHQLGASGIVFAFILLNSMVSAKYGQIPLAFVFTVVLYLGEELWLLLFPRDNVSHHAHLSGGLVGAVAGFYIQKELRKLKKQKSSRNNNKSQDSSNKEKALAGGNKLVADTKSALINMISGVGGAAKSEEVKVGKKSK